jgi:hypothetical protein
VNKAEDDQRAAPGSATSLVFAIAACPLAFMGHLVSLAVVLATLAILLAAWARWKSGRAKHLYSALSIRRATWGFRIGVFSLALSIGIWALWANGVLPIIP